MAVVAASTKSIPLKSETSISATMKETPKNGNENAKPAEKKAKERNAKPDKDTSITKPSTTVSANSGVVGK